MLVWSLYKKKKNKNNNNNNNNRNNNNNVCSHWGPVPVSKKSLCVYFMTDGSGIAQNTSALPFNKTVNVFAATASPTIYF